MWSVAGFSSLPVISSASLLAAGFFTPTIHPELLKSVVIPSMVVNLGLQLSTAQSHLLVSLSLSSQCAPCPYSCFLTWFTTRSVMLQSSRPKSHLEGARGRRDFRWWMLKKVVSALNYTASIIRLNLYSGQGAFHRGGKTEGERYFSFPSRTTSRAQIGTEGWAVSPGISILALAWRPPRETCQTHAFTSTRVSVVFSDTTEGPRGHRVSPPRSWPASVASDPTCSVFLRAPSDSHGCQAWRANESLAPQRPQRLPREKVTKTAAGGWNIHAAVPYIWVSPPHTQPRLSLSLASLSSLWMMHRWHNSPHSTWFWGSLVSDLWENINVVCGVWDGSNCGVKRRIFIWVHEHWVAGILVWHRLDVQSNRPVRKTREGASERTRRSVWQEGERDVHNRSRAVAVCL